MKKETVIRESINILMVLQYIGLLGIVLSGINAFFLKENIGISNWWVLIISVIIYIVSTVLKVQVTT